MKNNVFDILKRANKEGIRIELTNNSLSIKSENEKIDSELLKDIKSYKTSIVDHLKKYKNEFKTPSIISSIGAYDRATINKIPLSFNQERLWFIDKLQEGSAEYHMPLILKLKGNINEAVLDSALQEIISRHEILRTTIYTEEGIGYQLIKSIDQWRLIFQTYHKHVEIEEAIEAFVKTPFDLSQDYMVRACLYRLNQEECFLALVFHHIVADGWSHSIIIKEFNELYNARLKQRSPKLEPLPIQYADYGIWQKSYFDEVELEKQLIYWKTQLREVSNLILPLDYKRPSVQSTKGASYSFKLDDELCQEVIQLSDQEGVTLFMLLLSAFKIVLHRYSGQDDICIGTPIANRTVAELEGLIGFFVNTLAIRSDFSDDPTFIDILKKVKKTMLNAYEYQMVPFEKVVDAVVGTRDMSISPLFQVMFALQDTPEEIVLDGVDISIHEYKNSTSKFDFTMVVINNQSSLSLEVEYCTDLFKESTIHQMIVHYQQILKSIVKNPKERIGLLPMLTTTEEEQLLAAFNATQVTYPKDKTIVDLFVDRVNKQPENIAIVCNNRHITYKELDEASSRLANFLWSNYDIAKEDLIGVKLERSEWLIIAFLAVLKTGAAYVPIDPNYPKERIAYIESDSNCSGIIDDNLLQKFIQNEESYHTELPQIDIETNNLAYVIYTSGSTGKPKGVLIEHRGIINTILSQINDFFIKKTDHCLQFSNQSFDASIWEILISLLGGAKLFIIDENVKSDTNQFVEYIQDNKITFATLPPAFLKLIDCEQIQCINTLITAGEEAPLEQVKKISKSGTYINAYGPTETSICATTYRGNITSSVPIGKPISNTETYILDKNQQLLPIGCVGELCISGNGLARGYLNQEALTNEKFIPNPFFARDRIYRTGDLAKWLPDGNIEFIGRADNQVKIRGYRIELGEIEGVLHEIPEIDQSVVLAKEDVSGNKRLVGYVVTKKVFNKELIEEQLKSKLPEYMVPRLWISLDTIPITSNGKVDKKNLPDPDMSNYATAAYVAPRNETEEQLVTIWEALLNTNTIGIHDDFFELGGHSLLATQVIAKVRSVLNIELSIKDIFYYTTVSDLATYIVKQNKGSSLPQISKEEKVTPIPLSFSQERLWFLDQLQGSTEYHIPITFNLEGDLQTSFLESSLKEIVTRHEVLRTVIESKEGIPYQVILPSEDWQLSLVETTTSELEDQLIEFVNKPFDLATNYMLRGCLYQLGTNKYTLALVLHHIASDGWSDGILIHELTSLYASKRGSQDKPLNEIVLQYTDYAIWQRKYIEGEFLESQLQYWKEKLTGIIPLGLPLDFPRPSIQSTTGADLQFELKKELRSPIMAICKEKGVTPFMLLLAVFKVLMYRYSGQKDFAVGTSIANRTHTELEGLIGFFVNTLTIRSNLENNPTFDEVLKQVKETTIEAFDHQSVPFERIVEKVLDARDMSMNPLFQVMFEFQEIPESFDIELEGVNLSPYPYKNETSKFDLIMTTVDTGLGFVLNFEYCTDLFTEETMLRMAGHYQELLRSVIYDTSEKIAVLPMLLEREKEQILHGFNDTKVDYPLDKTVIEIFENQVQKTPDNIAVVFQGYEITYAELDARSNQLAHYLKDYGIVEDMAVAICIERSIEMIIGVLAILKSGGAYVPIKPDYPKSRIEYILNEIEATIVLTDISGKDIISKIPYIEALVLDEKETVYANHPKTTLEVSISPASLSYLIYTSGSTGKPKGVMIEHLGLLNHSLLMIDNFEMDSNSVVAFTAPFTFDISVWQMLSGLLCGGRIIVYSEKLIQEPSLFLESLQRDKINLLQLVPSYMSSLLEISSENDLQKLNYFLVTGEAVATALLSSWFDKYPNILVVNAYGPTEASDDISFHFMYEAPDAVNVSIGKPVANMLLYVVDVSNNLCPIGVQGELCVSGVGVGRGYLNDEEKTSKSFVTNPFFNDPQFRMYKTGDLARWLPDGSLEYLGRKDDQVKIRGHRIELGEIESVLVQKEEIYKCCVLAKEDSRMGNRLVGYVVCQGKFKKKEVQEYLKSKLPDYMVPAIWVELETMPLTANGKTDKKALPNPDITKLSTQEYIAPRNETEKELINIWKELLGVDKIGVYDDFFELGGHSLLATRLVSIIRKNLKVELIIRDIFEFTTIEELAGHIDLLLLDQGEEEYALTMNI